MNGVPDTTVYFAAGYTVMLLGMVIYLISLALRFRNLRQDEKMLEDIDEKDEAFPARPGNSGSDTHAAGVVMENIVKKE